jgi:hypothetical protein
MIQCVIKIKIYQFFDFFVKKFMNKGTDSKAPRKGMPLQRLNLGKGNSFCL